MAPISPLRPKVAEMIDLFSLRLTPFPRLTQAMVQRRLQMFMPFTNEVFNELLAEVHKIASK